MWHVWHLREATSYPPIKAGPHSLIHDARLLGPWPMFVSTAVFHNHPWFWLLTSIKSAIGMPSYPPKLAAPNPQTPAANPINPKSMSPSPKLAQTPCKHSFVEAFGLDVASTKTPFRRLLCDCCGDTLHKAQLETRLTQPRNPSTLNTCLVLCHQIVLCFQPMYAPPEPNGRFFCQDKRACGRQCVGCWGLTT